MTSQLTSLTPYFPEHSLVQSYLATRKKSAWIKTLEKIEEKGKKGVLLTDLFTAVVSYRNIENAQKFKKISETLDKDLKKIYNNETMCPSARKAFEVAHKTFKSLKNKKTNKIDSPKKPAPPKKPEAPKKEEYKGGIRNLGATCWLNALLQHISRSQDYDRLFSGPVRDAQSDDERQKLEELQTALNRAVNELRNHQTERLSPDHITTILDKLYACGMIDDARLTEKKRTLEQSKKKEAEVAPQEKQEKKQDEVIAKTAHEKSPKSETAKAEVAKEEEFKPSSLLIRIQFDSTEILKKILLKVGREIQGPSTHSLITYEDGSHENRVEARNNFSFELETTQANQTITQILNSYFGQYQPEAAKFEVKNEAGQIIATHDSSYGRTGNPAPVLLRLGQKVQKDLIRAQQMFSIKRELQRQHGDVDVILHPIDEHHFRFDAKKGDTLIKSYAGDFGITGTSPILVNFGRNAPQDLIYREQAAYIKEQYGNNVQVTCTKIRAKQLKIGSLPQSLDINVAARGGKPQIEAEIDLAPYLGEGVANNNSTRYELASVICRSGAVQHGAGGHFWYYKKVGDQWMCYDDSSVNLISDIEKVKNDINNYGYGLHYNKKG
jgi:hypothetical protein